jgi:hypothetical protein
MGDETEYASRSSAHGGHNLEYLGRPWRVGRKVGRTVYAVIGEIASDSDPLIGVMDTWALAEEAVEAHNARIRWKR